MRGDIACTNNWLIDASWLEQKITEEIENRYTVPEKVEEMIQNIASSVTTKNQEIDQSIGKCTNEIKKCELEIKRLLDAIKSGIDPQLISDEINSTKQKKDKLNDNIEALKQSYSKENDVDIEALRTFFSKFTIAYKSATISEKRELIRTFVRHIDLLPETKEIRIEFYPDQAVQSIGVGDPQLRKTMTKYS